jgi:hypothetical protein
VIRDTPEIRGPQQLLASALVGYWSFDRRGAALADLILIAEDWKTGRLDEQFQAFARLAMV